MFGAQCVGWTKLIIIKISFEMKILLQIKMCQTENLIFMHFLHCLYIKHDFKLWKVRLNVTVCILVCSTFDLFFLSQRVFSPKLCLRTKTGNSRSVWVLLNLEPFWYLDGTVSSEIGPTTQLHPDIGMVAILVWVTALSVLFRQSRFQLKCDSTWYPYGGTCNSTTELCPEA